MMVFRTVACLDEVLFFLFLLFSFFFTADDEEDEEEDSELDEVEAFRRYADSALDEFRSTGTVVAPDRVLNALRTLLESRGIDEAAEQLGRRLDFDIDEQD